MSHSDRVARDLSLLIHLPAGREAITRQPEFARALLLVSPHSACARGVLIEKNWDNVKGDVAQWEKDDGNCPALLAALARHHSAAKNYDGTGEYLARYITLSPDSWAFDLLAKNFKDRGDLKGWQETLDKYLVTAEDTGLEHARIRVEIANYFMGQKEWDKAWPYAAAAAETWAAWAMACAALCRSPARLGSGVALGPAGERAVPRVVMVAVVPVLQTDGTGRRQGGSALAENTLQSSTQNDNLGWFYWLCHDRQKAIPYLRQMYAEKPSGELCNTVLMAADDLGDADTREEFYRMFTSQYKDKGPKAAKIWEIFHTAFESKDRAAIDVKAVDEIIQSIAPERRWYSELHVGVFLTNHGNPEDARRYLESAKPHVGNAWRQALIGDCLTRLGVDPTRSKNQSP